MHPFVCALRRSHLPLQGRLWENCRPEGSPARGAVGVSGLRGAAPDLANTLPGSAYPPGLAALQDPALRFLHKTAAPPLRLPAGVNARPAMRGKRAAGPGTKPGAGFRDDASIVPYARPVRLVSLIGFGGAFPMVCRAGDLARRPVLRYDRALRCGADTKTQCFSAASFPGGRERPPYNARQAGGEIGAADCRTHWHRGRGLAIGPAVRAGAGRSRTGGGACPQR